MTAHKRVVPVASGAMLAILYCLWTYWIVIGSLPVWSTVGVGVATAFVLSWRAGRTDAVEGTWLELVRGVVVAVPAVAALIVYSGVGGMLRTSLDAFSGDPLTGTAPGTQFAATVPDGVSVPYSLFFDAELTGEISTAETYFALFVFDPIYMLIAMESLILFAIGCVIGALWYGRVRR
ncbi:hypothetical protein GS429_02675 [Natronorubrum sp. JWXQ-INN-674]|uniref:Uncharacterized protein n=1 Tax=Natronorubrum halalkaliphilum TaxID=2691917 RepID=A0A6B0VK96_9EURY|nr:hypothetical protein [Natronorubrum halalkaliphilum]MXV60979.1 hypothetical protein [Natronorubrum halalkaliphilum]